MKYPIPPLWCGDAHCTAREGCGNMPLLTEDFAERKRLRVCMKRFVCVPQPSSCSSSLLHPHSHLRPQLWGCQLTFACLGHLCPRALAENWTPMSGSSLLHTCKVSPVITVCSQGSQGTEETIIPRSCLTWQCRDHCLAPCKQHSAQLISELRLQTRSICHLGANPLGPSWQFTGRPETLHRFHTTADFSLCIYVCTFL